MCFRNLVDIPIIFQNQCDIFLATEDEPASARISAFSGSVILMGIVREQGGYADMTSAVWREGNPESM